MKGGDFDTNVRHAQFANMSLRSVYVYLHMYR